MLQHRPNKTSLKMRSKRKIWTSLCVPRLLHRSRFGVSTHLNWSSNAFFSDVMCGYMLPWAPDATLIHENLPNVNLTVVNFNYNSTIQHPNLAVLPQNRSTDLFKKFTNSTSCVTKLVMIEDKEIIYKNMSTTNYAHRSHKTLMVTFSLIYFPTMYDGILWITCSGTSNNLVSWLAKTG